MEFKNLKQTLFYTCAVGASILVLMFVIACASIGFYVKSECQNAVSKYGGDCVEALIATLEDENNGFDTRNMAIWALGQIGDGRALPILQEYYTGNIPSREAPDRVISQYELKKAIHLLQGGWNVGAWTWRNSLYLGKSASRNVIAETVVVCAPEDPYYELALKITRAEHLELAHNFSNALKFNPRFILLVAAPGNLTEARLLNMGSIFKSTGYYPALGMITGSTIEKAEQLWAWRGLAREGNNYLGTDVEKGQLQFVPAIFDFSGEEVRQMELNKENLISTLEQADYFYWARHVAADKWHWNTESEDFGESDKLYAADLPALKPAVIHSPSCGSFQPWRSDTISLGFVESGAAAYLGHVHSPMSSGGMMRHGLSVPGVYTWEGFPVGIAAQVQNRMTARFAFNTPLYFMLGDPRVYLSEGQPYQITSDSIRDDGIRVIEGESAVSGILPVRIEDGARYRFLTVGGASASEEDWFYNNDVQTLDLGGDKYILFHHLGGTFQIALSPEPPFGWVVGDALVDAFDHTWVVIGVVYDLISLVFLAVFAVIVYLKTLRQKKPLASYRAAFLAGGILAVVQVAYALARHNAYSVSANMIQRGIMDYLLGAAGVFSTTAGGLMVMKDTRRRAGKAVGLVLAVLPQVFLSGFYFVVITTTNLVFRFQNPVPIALWNYTGFWMPFIVLLGEAAVILAVNRLVISGRGDSPV